MYVTPADAEAVIGEEEHRRLYQRQGRYDEMAASRNAHNASKLVDLGLAGQYAGPFPLRASPIADAARIVALEYYLMYSYRRNPQSAAKAIEHKKSGDALMHDLRAAVLRLSDELGAETQGVFGYETTQYPQPTGLFPPGCGTGDLLYAAPPTRAGALGYRRCRRGARAS